MAHMRSPHQGAELAFEYRNEERDSNSPIEK